MFIRQIKVLNNESSKFYISVLQLAVAIAASSGRLTYGIISAMSGLMLAYFEKPSSEIKMDVNSGSWFGNTIIINLAQ